MQAPVLITGAPGTETLWFDGERCRQCGEPATHYVIRNVRPERWVAWKVMTVLAVPYCTYCSPVVLDWNREMPEPVPWWRKLLRTIGINAVSKG